MWRHAPRRGRFLSSFFNEALSLPAVVGAWDLGDPRSLASLSAEMNRQAAMLGYIDAFWAFALAAVVVLPLIALVRWKR